MSPLLFPDIDIINITATRLIPPAISMGKKLVDGSLILCRIMGNAAIMNMAKNPIARTKRIMKRFSPILRYFFEYSQNRTSFFVMDSTKTKSLTDEIYRNIRINSPIPRLQVSMADPAWMRSGQ